MKEPIEFTHREKFLINYYCDQNPSSRRLARSGQFGYVIGALAFGGMFFWNGEVPWLLVGYGISVWQLFSYLWRGRNYAENFASIFQKYEAKIAALEKTKKFPSET